MNIIMKCQSCDGGDRAETTVEAATAQGWLRVEEVPTPYVDDQWWTHLGYCAECAYIVRLALGDEASE